MVEFFNGRYKQYNAADAQLFIGARQVRSRWENDRHQWE